MSKQQKPIISHEGTSISFIDEINVEEHNVAGTRRSYLMRDWSLCSISVSSNPTFTGNIAVKQGMGEQSPGEDPDSGALAVSASSSETFGIEISGGYLILDFAGVTQPAEGVIRIVILGKRSR